jgi:hypothetical protein
MVGLEGGGSALHPEVWVIAMREEVSSNLFLQGKGGGSYIVLEEVLYLGVCVLRPGSSGDQPRPKIAAL